MGCIIPIVSYSNAKVCQKIKVEITIARQQLIPIHSHSCVVMRFVVRLLFVVTGSRSGGSSLLGDTSRRSLSVGGVDGEINVFFGGSSYVERRNGYQLRTDTDVALSDQDTRVVDGLSKSLLVDLGLESTFQQLLCRQLEDGIEFQLVLGQQTVTVHSAEEGGSLENTLGVLRIQSQQGTSRLSQLGECVLDTPDLTLTAETVLSYQFQLSI